MNLSEFKERINSLVSFAGFEYNGKNCGIDPINREHFEMWYGGKSAVFENIDDVFENKFFDDKSLAEIFEKITDIDI